ncbi:hypothetical protein RND71_034124 [Anisodus tanguticus]|uniref:ZF-HD dimerization-type domain-containing protein n=1 Tax=Anisodus tanguticus TaxID=243964 RepID=A0AAE1V4N7_9SOLA|nr:hypothetical protein RND71_034124 [Anisodus tanguticus]
MDLTTNNTTTTTTTSSSAIKTPKLAETETPTRIQQLKPFLFSNGVLKRKNHPSLNHHHHPVVVIYKECLKNHAASLGGHAVDGCGEFMPSPTANPVEPTSLKCAACGCHRNFHRREPDEPVVVVPSPAITTAALEYQPHHRHHPPPPPPQQRGDHSIPNSPSPPPISSAYYPASTPHMLLALSAGFLGDKNPNPTSAPVVNSNGRKRFRTKFTPDQKVKMLEFAERVEWKMLKRDEDLVSNFCNKIGVEKSVLKVWMHNNKNTFGKKLDQHVDDNNNNSGNTNNVNGFCIVSRNNNTDLEFHIHHESSNVENKKDNSSFGANNVVATNGSSSSS